MVATPSPTARRFELAKRLRELRTASGYSVEDVAQELACSTAKVSRIENGQRIATPLDVKVLASFYGLSARVRDDLMGLAVDARKRGWWQDFRALDEVSATYVGLETAASNIRQAELVRVPGLLQTPDYVRQVLPRSLAPRPLSDAELNEYVELRQARQQRLISGAATYHAVIDESALLRRLGKPPLMLAQVDRLIEVAKWPNVTIQVVTLETGSHPGLEDAFTLLDFPESLALAATVFLESVAGGYLLRADDKPDVIDRFKNVFEILTTTSALSESDTYEWLKVFRENMYHQINDA